MSKRSGGNAGAGHMMGGLFTFALFGMFVILSLLIVVIGVDGYKGVVDTGDSTNQMRTALGYVVGKVRSEAATDGIALEERQGVTVLVLTQLNDSGDPIETIIYHQDGVLLEAYNNAAVLDFDPEFGRRLTEIDSFAMARGEDGLLSFTAATKDGRAQTVRLAPRVPEGVRAGV